MPALPVQQSSCWSTSSKLLHGVVLKLGRYATLATLAGVDPADDVEVNGTIRSIDGVNVWPMLTDVNTSHPRVLTPVTETAIIEITPDGTWWKLITLAGQSNRFV